MINIEFNQAVKNLGAKWDGAKWTPPKLATAEFEALDNKYNGDLIPVELTLTDDNKDTGAWLGTAHAVAICGYVLAVAYGRDSGAKVSPNVAVLDGGFTSGGSVKNYRCAIKGDAVRVRCEVGRALLPALRERDPQLVVIGEQADETKTADADAKKTAIKEFLDIIARMNYDGEERADGTEFIMENDDAVSTLSDLIAEARRIQAL